MFVDHINPLDNTRGFPVILHLIPLGFEFQKKNLQKRKEYSASTELHDIISAGLWYNLKHQSLFPVGEFYFACLCLNHLNGIWLSPPPSAQLQLFQRQTDALLQLWQMWNPNNQTKKIEPNTKLRIIGKFQLERQTCLFMGNGGYIIITSPTKETNKVFPNGNPIRTSMRRTKKSPKNNRIQIIFLKQINQKIFMYKDLLGTRWAYAKQAKWIALFVCFLVHFGGREDFFSWIRFKWSFILFLVSSNWNTCMSIWLVEG